MIKKLKTSTTIYSSLSAGWWRGERGEWGGGGGQLLTKEAVLVAAGNYIPPLMNELDAVKGRFNDTDTDEAIVIPEIPQGWGTIHYMRAFCNL